MFLDNIVDIAFFIPIALVALITFVMSIIIIIGIFCAICGNEHILHFGLKNIVLENVPVLNAICFSFFLMLLAFIATKFDLLSTRYLIYFYPLFSISCLWYLIYTIDIWYSNYIEYKNIKKENSK